MALADYDTAVEKIAALKAASLDPSICNVLTNTDTPFTATEDAYIIYADAYLDLYEIYSSKGLIIQEYSGTFDILKVSTNEIVDASFLIYVKDSDIIYSEPITTYQDRLSELFTNTPNRMMYPDSFTAGVNGTIIINGHEMVYNGFKMTGSPITQPIPIPAGSAISTVANFEGCSYFDVPADW